MNHHLFARQSLCWLVTLVFANALSANSAAQGESPEEASGSVSYSDVRAILRKRCVTCHNPEELRGDLNLSELTAIEAGGSSGPVVVAGKPNQSLLYTTAAHLEEPSMPPNSRKIPGRELELLRKWIEQMPGAAQAEATRSIAAGEPAMAEQATAGSPPADRASRSYSDLKPVFQAAAIRIVAAHPKLPLVALGINRQIVLLDAAEKKFVGAIEFEPGEVTAVTFSRDGSWLVAAGGVPGLSGTVVVYDLASGERLFQFADETDSIVALDIAPDKRLVAAGGPTKVVRVFEVNTGQVRYTLRKHTDWVLDVSFSPDGLLLASSDRFGGVLVWETESGELFFPLTGHTGAVQRLAWDDAETLLSAGQDGNVRIWNLHHGTLTGVWDGGVGEILGLDVHDGVTLVGGRDRRLAAWRGPEVQIGSFADEAQLEAVAIVTGDCAVSTDQRGHIRLHQLPGLEAIAELTLPISPDGAEELQAWLEEQQQAYEQFLAEQETSLAAAASNDSMGPEEPSTAPATLALLGQQLKDAEAAWQRKLQLRDELAATYDDLGRQLKLHTDMLEKDRVRIEQLKQVLSSLGTGQGSERAALQLQMEEHQLLLEKARRLREEARAFNERWDATPSAESLKLLQDYTVELEAQADRLQSRLMP